MTKEELKELKKLDHKPLHLISTEERGRYIFLLRKLHHEVQLSLDLVQGLKPTESK